VAGRFGHFLYNSDRAIASLIWGTTQETISSEVGRYARGEPPVGTPAIHNWLTQSMAVHLAHWLDNTPSIWGVDHTLNAIEHANALNKVDDGHEQ